MVADSYNDRYLRDFLPFLLLTRRAETGRWVSDQSPQGNDRLQYCPVIQAERLYFLGRKSPFSDIKSVATLNGSKGSRVCENLLIDIMWPLFREATLTFAAWLFRHRMY